MLAEWDLELTPGVAAGHGAARVRGRTCCAAASWARISS